MIIRINKVQISIEAILVNATIAFMLILSYFCFNHNFIEAYILPKQYAFIITTVLLFLTLLFSSKRSYISFDRITLALCIFGCYICSYIFCSDSYNTNLSTLSFAAFAVLYFSFRLLPEKYTANFNSIVIWICLLQSIYGILQYAGLVYSYKGFRITGNFDNPAGFAASLIAGYPFCLACISKSSGRTSWFGILTSIIILIAVLLSGSRAGMMALLIITILHFGEGYYNRLKTHFKWLLPLLGIVVMLCGIVLFHIKKDSALGRILIWNTSCEMIAEKPLFGHGANALGAEYMFYQAKYFNENPDSRFALLADNTKYTFNEFISLTINYGIIGLLLLILLVLSIIKSEKKLSTELLCMLSIAIFACFSYPLRYPSIWIFMAFCVASFSKSDKHSHSVKIPLNASIRLVSIFAMILIGAYLARDIKFELDWGRQVNMVRLGNIKETQGNYAALYDRWNGNPLFLYNYGATLNHLANYEKSNELMKQCAIYLNDYDVHMIIGDNYFYLEAWDQAICHYRIAHNMIPNRFMPLSQLMCIYQRTCNLQLRDETANIILNKVIKVPSTTVSRIIGEASIIIERQAPP